MKVDAYRQSEQEQTRTADLLRLLPKGRRSVLDIGARDGHFSRLFTAMFSEVTALDLQKPTFDIPGVLNVAGDVTDLQFPDNSFDCVFCAEVLEHVPAVERACKEIARVARHEVVIGVPYKQDTRLGRTKCSNCGKVNPPYGHVNTFNENRLYRLFPDLSVTTTSFVGSTTAATNAVSAMLMDMAGHPWGVYDQDEPCIFCGSRIDPPKTRNLIQKVSSSAAARIDRLQQLLFARPHGNWIHVLFSKPS